MDINQIIDSLLEAIKMPFSYIASNSGKRIYWLYLLSSAVIAFLVFRYSKRREKNFFKYILNKNVWLSKSAFVDYLLLIFNGFVKVFFIGPYLILGLYLAFYVNEYLAQSFGFPEQSLSPTLTVVLYTIVLTIVGDFFSFFIHYIMHKVPFLWEFHKIHHSATTMNPVTQYRIHPVELILTNITSIFVFGVVTGVFDYLSNHQVSKWTFIGVNVFGFLFMFLGANLRHSHVKLKYPTFLEKFLISPYQHQIHHSNAVKHYDKNMGSKFAFWDWMFGTLVLSKDAKKIEFGLGQGDDKNYVSFWQNLYMPFKNLYLSLTKLFK